MSKHHDDDRIVRVMIIGLTVVIVFVYCLAQFLSPFIGALALYYFGNFLGALFTGG